MSENQLEKIRKLKHSVLISNDVRKLMLFKQKYKRLSKTNFEQYKAMARTHCKYLYNKKSRRISNLYNRRKVF